MTTTSRMKHLTTEQLNAIAAPARIDLTISRDGIWLIFETAAERADARDTMCGGWITLDDRSVRLNYVNEWTDVNGYGLHVAYAPAFCPTWQRVLNPAGQTKRAADLTDGDVFSTDFGQTWHTFAEAGFGTVACYLHPDAPRTPSSLTYRVPAQPATVVAVRPAPAGAPAA